MQNRDRDTVENKMDEIGLEVETRSPWMDLNEALRNNNIRLEKRKEEMSHNQPILYRILDRKRRGEVRESC